LVKLLFTADRLSVQVHPDDGEDGPRGKSEMWYILDAEPGAAIALGFREPVTRERLRESTGTKEIESLLNWMPVKAGETYFATAHTVHAIGAGIVLCEIQQNSDVTYRLWDYGRPRPIHVDQAVAIADLGIHPGARPPVSLGAGREELVRSKHFVTELVRLSPGQELRPEPRMCQLWICLEGHATIGAEPCRAGEVWLLPETGDPAVIRASVAAKFLRTWVPQH
jgi:mannose-6-phosphate isomerase